MERFPPKPKRGGPRKGERKVRVYGTADLMKMFDCIDIDELVILIRALGIMPYLSGGHVFVSDYQLPADIEQPPEELWST